MRLMQYQVDDLLENEAFCKGVQVGIGIHQQRVIAARERGEPIMIGDMLFFTLQFHNTQEKSILFYRDLVKTLDFPIFFTKCIPKIRYFKAIQRPHETK